MWIKICGLTTADAIEAALAANVDALGFVFAKSVRQLTPDMAAKLAAPARGRAKCVAVTRHPAQRDVDEILQGFSPDILQTDAADLRLLRLPAQLQYLPVLRDADVAADASLDAAGMPLRLLFEGASSGAGIPCDWTVASRLVRRTELVLAGGLRPDNVAAAIEAVRPFGVDVSSGVEARPGVKSPAAITHFVQAVRATPRA
jgi:phosphoribosylanthranilate isomerase